jgi:hypothetical protein
MQAFEAAPSVLTDFAHAYRDNGLDLRVVGASADTYRGGLVLTVSDLTRFIGELLDGRVVSAGLLASMHTESLVYSFIESQ